MVVKNIIQDVIPKDGSRSIRNVQITRSKPRFAAPKSPQNEDESFKRKILEVREEFAPEEEIIEPRRPITWNPKKWLIIGGSILAVIVGFLVTNLFFNAKITVTPKSSVVVINANIVTKLTPGAQDLAFQNISVSHDASVVVKSTGEQQVDKRASGTIIIYNNYSSASQRLIKNTRFVTPDNLIYRIDQSVNVPGKKGTIPGSVEAVVFAEEAGEKYNAGLKDFVIPGFKGDPRYTAFYARSKPGFPLAGGFSGIMKVVSDSDKKSAEVALQKELKDALMKDILAKVPTGSLTFDTLYRIDWTPLTQENLDSNQVRIKETGTLSAVAIDKKALATYLARAYVSDYKNENIEIQDIEKLKVAPKTAIFNPSTDKTVEIIISGSTKFVWLFDELEFRQALLGKSRSQFYEILKQYPMITKADISLTPFWKGSFPSTLSKISIIKSTN